MAEAVRNREAIIARRFLGSVSYSTTILHWDPGNVLTKPHHGGEPEVDEWANLAGDARRTGEEGGPAQCALAAARNASRDANLTRTQFMQWCVQGVLPLGHWLVRKALKDTREGGTCAPLYPNPSRLDASTQLAGGAGGGAMTSNVWILGSGS